MSDIHTENTEGLNEGVASPPLQVWKNLERY